jgi:hypothetical protein
MIKTCTRCGQSLSIEMFGKSSSSKDGLKSNCKPCWNALARKYHHDNIDKVKEYREKNSEKRRQQQKIWYAENKECVAKRNAEWRLNNVPVWKSSCRRWRESNKEIANMHTRKANAARTMATPPWVGKLQRAQIDWFYAASKMMSETSGTAHNVDHIHPLQGDGFSGLHVPWNLRVVPVVVNSAKGNRLPKEYADLSWNGV